MLSYKREVELAIKPCSTHLKYPVTIREYDSCYQIVRFNVCWRLFLLQFNVSVVPLFSSYALSFNFDPYLFQLNRLMTIKQRYITIACLKSFIYR